MQKVHDCLAYSTAVLTYANSGAVPGSVLCLLRKWDETVINSVTPTSSGNGLYFAVVPMPGSRQWMVNEWISVINANTYIDRQFIHVTYPQVSTP